MNVSSLLSGALALALAASPLAAQTAARSTVQVSKPWTRATATGQAVGGGYLVLRNSGPVADRLVGARSPAAERVELHSMAMEGDVMKMRPVDAVDVPAGGSVELKPGGLHLMLLGLRKPLQPGQAVPVTLRFEKAGEVPVQLQVQGSGAPAQDTGHGHGAGHEHDHGASTHKH